MKVPFKKLEVGDFFSIDIDLGSGKNTMLYKKIKDSSDNYNAVLINTGELCQLYIPADSDKMFEKVEVHFEIRSL
jgi:hypothetical protein